MPAEMCGQAHTDPRIVQTRSVPKAHGSMAWHGRADLDRYIIRRDVETSSLP
jgi:hypothetical protein